MLENRHDKRETEGEKEGKTRRLGDRKVKMKENKDERRSRKWQENKR